ncbi:NCS2 family permease [Parendozoicomonas sp. Alg238-R29]|uniref:NCS2 family permease n=1 Tax=Parendozoicomonas sp. Alg238-R29 TaxID=2993446 RepID=UPI00248D9ED4|nr:NCS2 family permease [Parendozoicomonas sp. Alg238-R29]
MLEKIFHLSENNTNVRQEVLAGVTTFLTMAYIIFVNPSLLAAAGMDHGAVFVATCLAAAIGCFIMGLYANYPVALAPGMGLNAFFAFTVVGQMGYTWQVALGAVFFSGICFFLMSVFRIREWIINSIPLSLRGGIGAGIGLFLGFLGLQNAGIVIENPATMVSLGDMTSWGPMMASLGFIIIAALYHRGVTGSVMFGILTVSLISIAVGEVQIDGVFALPPSIAPTILQLDLAGAMDIGLITIIFSFLFVDMFDTSGTMIAVAQKGNLLNKDGSLPRIGKALMADSTATVAGSLLGTSTTTSYIESGAGIAVGGRTGLTAVVVGILFLLSLFLSPLAAAIPAYATAPALIFVAVLMCHSLTTIDWEDITDVAPVGIAALAMPLTYSVASGIAFGVLSWTAIKLLAGRGKEITPAMIILSALFAIKFVIV